MIVVVPTVITLTVVVQIFAMTETLLGRHSPIRFSGFGMIVSVALILLVGIGSSDWLMRRLMAYGERLLGTIPILTFMDHRVKQLSEAVFESKNLCRQAVLASYPGVKALELVSSELSPPPEHWTKDCRRVCAPRRLNMTSGVDILAPRRQVVFLDVTGESALPYVITAGAATPSRRERAAKDKPAV